MGYLLKTEDKILMFYSEPEEGHYRGDTVCLTAEEYDNREDDEFNEFVRIDGWYDASNGFNEIANGVEVDEFVIDCILQGKKLETNKPFEF
jgi:hypothetical protein